MSSDPKPPSTTNRKSLQERGFKFLESPYFWLFFLVLAFGLPLFKSFIRPSPEKLPVLATLPAFRLQDQDGKIVSNESLDGAVLVVNFIYTSCPDVCPLLTAQMKKIQERVRTADQQIRLLSISVDPQTDTPAVLKKYADKYNPSYRQWSFLTGSLDDVQKVVVGGFKVGLDKASPAAKSRGENDPLNAMLEITHGEHFVIVDQKGQIRAYVRASDSAGINDLVKKVAVLVNTAPPRGAKTP